MFLYRYLRTAQARGFRPGRQFRLFVKKNLQIFTRVPFLSAFPADLRQRTQNEVFFGLSAQYAISFMLLYAFYFF